MSLGGDIKMFFDGTTADTITPADLVILTGSADPVRDAGLETAVLIAVFSDRRADDDDVLPNVSDTRGGYFGDSLAGTKIGSKLWLLGRSRLNDATLKMAEQYISEALQDQIIGAGLAESSDVSCKAINGQMRIEITLTGSANRSILYTYFLNWQSQFGRA